MAFAKIKAIVSPKLEFRHEEKRGVSYDRLLALSILFCLISVLAQIILIFAFWGKLPPEIPFFYSRPWGEVILASPIVLWILPAIALFLPLLNFLVAIFLKEKDFLLRTLAVSSLLIALMTLLGLAKIILLLT